MAKTGIYILYNEETREIVQRMDYANAYSVAQKMGLPVKCFNRTHQQHRPLLLELTGNEFKYHVFKYRLSVHVVTGKTEHSTSAKHFHRHVGFELTNEEHEAPSFQRLLAKAEAKFRDEIISTSSERL